MHRDLDFVDAIAVGMFLQTFVLALTARGLGSCVQVSVAGYPDPTFPANSLKVPRNPLDANFTFIED